MVTPKIGSYYFAFYTVKDRLWFANVFDRVQENVFDRVQKAVQKD